MLICPFCHFENEDGALFCDQCKSDMSGVEPTPSAPMMAEPVMAEPVMAEPVEPEPVEAEPFMAEPVEPEPVAAEPVEAEPIPAEPMAADVIASAPVEAPPVSEAPPEPEPAQPVSTPPEVPAMPAAAPTPDPMQTMSSAGAAAASVQTAPAQAPAGGGQLPAGAEPKLIVLRGLKRNAEYPIYEGLNFIGRSDDKPVDIDLDDQESPDRVWTSRQHACINLENNELSIEDLNSSNGTYVNRARIYPGQRCPLNVNDVVQIGNVQLKVIV